MSKTFALPVLDARSFMDECDAPVTEPLPKSFCVIIPSGFSLKSFAESNVGKSYLYIDQWLKDQAWFPEPLDPGMYQVCLQTPDSNNKTFDTQVRMLPQGYLPSPPSLAATAICFLQKEGLFDDFLDREAWLRTSQVTTPGDGATIRFYASKPQIVSCSRSLTGKLTWLVSHKKVI